MNFIEHSSMRGPDEMAALLADMREARAAARRLGVGCVERGPDGGWRPATWQGSRTEAADRRQREVRGLPAPTGRTADRARRLRLAEAAIEEPPALDRRATHPFFLGLFLGFGPARR